LDSAEKNRTAAIDVLRGVAVVIWVGSQVAIAAFSTLPMSSFSEWAMKQLSKSIWHGLTLFDHVLPAFLTAMGASLVFSNVRRSARGDSARERLLHIFGRSSLLFLIGFLCTGGFEHSWPDVRVTGILQRVAVCYAVAAISNVLLGVRGLIGAVVFLLLEYWALMAFGDGARQGAGRYTMDGNFAAHVDQLFLPGRAYFGNWDPEGILTAIPAVATTLIGVLIGHCLKSPYWDTGTKLLTLGGCGALAITNGILLGDHVPTNVHLWTPSFVLVTSGVLAVIVAGLFWLTDVRGWRSWALPFVVAGRNALPLVIAFEVVRFDLISSRLIGGDIANILGPGAPVLRAFVELSLIGWLAWWLYRRRIFLTA